jgi:hypothetical protein
LFTQLIGPAHSGFNRLPKSAAFRVERLPPDCDLLTVILSIPRFASRSLENVVVETVEAPGFSPATGRLGKSLGFSPGSNNRHRG